MILAAALLIGVFIVAVKILKAAFEVATVAVISAAFYTVLAASFDFPLTVDSVLWFTALGTGLYVTYSILFPLLELGWGVVTVPYDTWNWFNKKLGEAKRSRRLSKIEDTLNRHEEKLDDDEEEEGSKTKEVVLDKVAGDDSSQE